jgi:NADH-quinone oxidoreductase subunit N
MYSMYEVLDVGLSIISLIPELFFVISISAVLLYGAYASQKVQVSVSVYWLSVEVLMLGGLLNWNNEFKSGALLYGSLYHDNLTATGKMLLMLFGGLCLLASKKYIKKEGLDVIEYPIIIVMSTWGLGLLISAYDLMSLYLALELQSLGLYVMAAIKRESAYSTEAGLKYFVMGAFASGIFLFGSTLIYGYTGTTNFEDLGRLGAMGGEIYLVGLFLVTVGIFFKIAAAPFHMWSPDVYEGSPTSSTIFFAVVPKLAFFGVMIRLFYGSGMSYIGVWQNWLIGVAIISMVVAVLSALYQRRIKRFLAFSSIGHVAYMLMGLGCGTTEGLIGVLVYIMIYMIMTLNVWTIVVSSAKKVQYMDEMVELGRRNGWLGVTIALVFFSMAGIPPLAGFYSKMYVFFAAMEATMYGVAIVGVIGSVISAYYYLRWVKIIFFERGGSVTEQGMEKGVAMIITGTTLILILFFINPVPIIMIAEQMVS